MLKSIKLGAAGSVIALLLTGLTYAATRPVPKVQPHVALQADTGVKLSGDAQVLNQALDAKGPVNYKVLVVDSTNGEDKTAYLERVAKEWGAPTGDGLLLVVFTQDNYDLRFYMGSIFRAHGVTVDEMLKLVRDNYLPKARQQDAAGGLVALKEAVNQRITGVAAHATAAVGQAPAPGQVAADLPPTTARAATAPASSKPQAQGPTAAPPAPPKAQTPATPQSEIGKSLLTSYLNEFKSERVPEAQRLTDFRFDLSNLTPTDATADRIRFQVKFDVLPTSTHASGWLAGNGHQDRNGWMVDNSVIMTAVKQGASWKLDSFTTP